MDPAMIIAAIEAGVTVTQWIGGVIERHNAGQAPSEDEVVRLNVMGGLLNEARAENDASDARLDGALGD